MLPLAPAAVTRVLHVGCGRRKYGLAKLAEYVGLSASWDEHTEVWHLDADLALNPTLRCTLGTDDIDLDDDSVDLVIAWHVLEHIKGSDAWFKAWEDLYRVLKPGGWIYAESPYYDSIWAWSDPTHVRAISEHSLIFFSQASYRVPDSMISPYRLRCDFQFLSMPGLEKGWTVITDPGDARNRMLRFAMSAVKPLRPWWED